MKDFSSKNSSDVECRDQHMEIARTTLHIFFSKVKRSTWDTKNNLHELKVKPHPYLLSNSSPYLRPGAQADLQSFYSPITLGLHFQASQAALLAGFIMTW